MGAPLQRGAVNQMGKIYWCRYRAGKCQEVPVTGEDHHPLFPPTPPKLDSRVPEEDEEEDGLTSPLPRTPKGCQRVHGVSASRWGHQGPGEYGVLGEGLGGVGCDGVHPKIVPTWAMGRGKSFVP